MESISTSRRSFIGGAVLTAAGAATWLGFDALGTKPAGAGPAEPGLRRPELFPVNDRATGLPLINLPKGFEYTTFGWTGDAMDDGIATPAKHDGMAAFRDRGSSTVRLVRNHEQGDLDGAYAEGMTYDPMATGGTTNLSFDLHTREFTGSQASLAGTIRNCAGGPTPWGSWLSSAEHPHTILAHIDPYDPRLPGASGLSALDLARELIGQGAGLMYWYGYDRPEHRAWALDELSTGATDRPLWCGDIMVTSGTNPRTRSDGDLGLATTPGTGFGIVCGNISDRSLTACQRLGEELSLAYDAIALPDGTAGHLDFASLHSSGYPTHSTTS